MLTTARVLRCSVFDGSRPAAAAGVCRGLRDEGEDDSRGVDPAADAGLAVGPLSEAEVMAIELEDAVERAIELALPVAAVSAAEDEERYWACARPFIDFVARAGTGDGTPAAGGDVPGPGRSAGFPDDAGRAQKNGLG